MTPVVVRRLGASAIVLLPVIVLAAAAAMAQPTADRGEALVERHCGGCHATRRSDASREPAAPPLRELHRRYEPEMLSEALAEGILTGHPAMPSFRFGRDDVESIIIYLNTIQVRQKT